MMLSASHNTIVKSLYTKFQPTNYKLNSNQKMYFWNQKWSHSIFFIASEARVSAQLLLPTCEQFCGGITDHITHELSLPTTARPVLRELESLFWPHLLQFVEQTFLLFPDDFFAHKTKPYPCQEIKLLPLLGPKALIFFQFVFWFFLINISDTENLAPVCKEEATIPVLSLWKELSRCPWDLNTEEKASRRLWIFTVAVLTISAADPWTAVFTAWRSAWTQRVVLKTHPQKIKSNMSHLVN